MEEECGKLKAILAEQDLILQVRAAPPDNAPTRLLVKLAARSMAAHEFLSSRVFSLSRPQYGLASVSRGQHPRGP